MSDREPAVALQCAWCGRVAVEGVGYLGGPRDGRLEADRSHGICPACLRRELRFLEEAVLA